MATVTCKKCGVKIDYVIMNAYSQPKNDLCIDCYKKMKGIVWKKPPKKKGKQQK